MVPIPLPSPDVLLFLLVPDQKCLFFLLQVVPSAGHSSSDRYKKSSRGSVLLQTLHLSHRLLPFPCRRELGLDLPLPTETTWVFMGLPYTESWQISGETPACKKIKGKERL